MSVVLNINGQTVNEFDEFSYSDDFFNPVNNFSFRLSGDSIDLIKSLPNYCPIQITIDNNILITGFLDKRTISFNRGAGGSYYTLTGRNQLGYVADSTNLPLVQTSFKAGLSYKQVLTNIFEPFKLSVTEIPSEEPIDKKTLRSRSENLSALLKNQMKGKQIRHRNEGCLELAIRFAKRNGWNIQGSRDGKSIIVTPVLYKDAPFTILDNQVLNANYSLDTSKQPTIMIGNNKSLAGNYNVTEYTTVIPNELTAYQADGTLLPSVDAYIKNNLKGSLPLPKNDAFFVAATPFIFNSIELNPVIRPYYAFDDNSTGGTQNVNFTRMKMYDFQRNFFTCDISVPEFFNSGKLWETNKMVNLNNINNLFGGQFWISRVNFRYSRSTGSITNLSLNLPYIYDF